MPIDPATAARAIHSDLPVVDGHNDLPWRLRVRADGDLDLADPRHPLPGYHTDIPRLLEGGVGGQFWSVFVPSNTVEPFATTNRQIDLVEAMVARDDRLELARSGDDVRRIRSEGRIASLIGAEGGHCIESDLGRLRDLADRGVRYLTLTHSDNTPWADSATDDPVHGGLTSLGRQVVREMNRLGMLVDISHVSSDTMRDALDASDAPVIASHSNARAVADHPRNVPDDILRDVGARDGVVMAVFVPSFVVPESAAAMRVMIGRRRAIRDQHAGDESAIVAEIKRMEAELGIDMGTVAHVVDHIEHIAAVAGVDAVGIGSDFDGMKSTPQGLEDVSCFPAITEELLRRSWNESDIRKVLGNNILRVLDRVR